MHPLEMIEKVLPDLGVSDLETIHKKVTLLLSTKKRKTDRMNEEAFYSILDNELSKRLKTKGLPYQKFKRTNTYKMLGTAFDSTTDYMEVVFKNERMTRVKKLQFYLIACKIVLRDFETSPVPLSIRTMLQSFNILPGLIDKAFPGYVQGGVLSMILKQKYANKKPLEEVNNEKR